MINPVSNSLTSSSYAQRDYVIVDGKRYPVQKKQSSKPGVCTFAPVYKDVVVIDGKEYPVEKVSDRHCCDGTKDVIIIDGKEYDVNPNFTLNTFFPSLNEGKTQANQLNYVA